MLMRDVEKLKEKVEISLDSRQVFFLFFGAAFGACLVFALGVMVGRRLEGREHVDRRAGTSAAIDPLAALDELAADEEEELAFPSALAGGNAGRAKPVSEKTAPKPASSDKPGDKPTPIERPNENSAGRPGDKLAAKSASVTVAESAIPAPPPPIKPALAKSPEKKTGKFTLQLSSFQEKGQAESFVAKLISSGYRPYVVASEVPGRGMFYRVRVGQYATHDDALAAKGDFEKRQHIIAYVTRL